MRPPKKRHRPSSIDRLEPEIRDLIGKLRIDSGWTIDEIHTRLLELDPKSAPSRSALGRHVKSLEEIGAQLRQSREVAQALVSQIGDAPEDRVADLNIELMHSMILRLLTATNDTGDGAPIVFMPDEIKFMSQSLQSLAGARKTNVDVVMRVRQETAKAAAKKASEAVKARGLGKETADWIYNEVLGVAG
ncbi:MAG TPA: phage protein Gp27 family protein [Sphingobium sp.]